MIFFSLTEAPLPDPTQHPETDPKQTRSGAKRSQTDPKRSQTEPKWTEIKPSRVGQLGGFVGRGRGGGCKGKRKSLAHAVSLSFHLSLSLSLALVVCSSGISLVCLCVCVCVPTSSFRGSHNPKFRACSWNSTFESEVQKSTFGRKMGGRKIVSLPWEWPWIWDGCGEAHWGLGKTRPHQTGELRNTEVVNSWSTSAQGPTQRGPTQKRTRGECLQVFLPFAPWSSCLAVSARCQKHVCLFH